MNKKIHNNYSFSHQSEVQESDKYPFSLFTRSGQFIICQDYSRHFTYNLSQEINLHHLPLLRQSYLQLQQLFYVLSF